MVQLVITTRKKNRIKKKIKLIFFLIIFNPTTVYIKIIFYFTNKIY